jgi:hypothetical protein
VNKKKQKNFVTLGLGRDVANAHGPESKEFFGSFFPKKNRFLTSSRK